jgi:hypothetical protein
MLSGVSFALVAAAAVVLDVAVVSRVDAGVAADAPCCNGNDWFCCCCTAMNQSYKNEDDVRAALASSVLMLHSSGLHSVVAGVPILAWSVSMAAICVPDVWTSFLKKIGVCSENFLCARGEEYFSHVLGVV